MGWAIGEINGRDVGYGVPAVCDQPECEEPINRGLSYICGSDIGGGEHGCGLFFCGDHLFYGAVFKDDCSPQLCDICFLNSKIDLIDSDTGYKCHAQTFTPKDDTEEWCHWKLVHESWGQWRSKNPEELKKLKEVVAAIGEHDHEWGEEE
jgi:hypothetical protein